MNKKEFKTLDEQLGIFKSKGLTINDEEEARNILLKENYFFMKQNITSLETNYTVKPSTNALYFFNKLESGKV